MTISTGLRSGQPTRTTDRHGFTLVELLVVIAIVGVLVALLLPAVQSAREASRRVQCSNQLKQIGLAVLNFESSRSALPPGSVSAGVDISGPYYSTWTAEILPYLEEQSVYDRWDQEQPLSGAANQPFRETRMSVYMCPVDIMTAALQRPESGPGTRLDWAPGSYRAMSGHSLGINGDHYWDNPRAALNAHRPQMPDAWQGAMHTTSRDSGLHRLFQPVKLRQVVDGTSKTLLVGEYQTISRQPRRTFWAYGYTSYNQSSTFFESRTLIADYDQCQRIGGGGVHTCKRGWGSLHLGGVQFVYCDGSVNNVSVNVDVHLFVAAATIRNTETGSLSSE